MMVRKVIAVGALVALGGLIITSGTSGPPGTERFLLAVRALLVPLLITIVGLVLEVYWSRWLALATAIAVLPWATALVLAPFGLSRLRPAIALLASLLLLFSLIGPRVFSRYEGRSTKVEWGGRRMALVRWTIICNVASVLGLYLFVVAYDYAIGWHVLIPASLLLGLILAVLLLAHQKTMGVLLLALCVVLFVPAGSYFVWTEARSSAEAFLFAVLFLPGVLTSWGALLSFIRPMWRFVSADR